jgi:hypothetical protein
MKHNFSPIQNSLEKILDKYKLYESFEAHSLLNNWQRLVGSHLAAVSKPVDYDPDTQTLTIRLKSESWKNEFFKEKHRLLTQLRSQLKKLEITDIYFE